MTKKPNKPDCGCGSKLSCVCQQHWQYRTLNRHYPKLRTVDDRHLMAFTANHALVARLDEDPTLIDTVFDGMKAIVNEHQLVCWAWARFDLAYQDRDEPFRPHLHGVLVVRQPIRVAEISEIWRDVVPVDESGRSVVGRPINEEEGGLYGWMWYCLKPLIHKGWSSFRHPTAEETRQVNQVLFNRHKVRFYPRDWKVRDRALGEHGVKRAKSGYDQSLLSDDEWESVRPCLPPQKPATGRPAKDHRLILEGILWVKRGGGKWKDMPAKYGSWGTISSRCSRWDRSGVWPAVAERLGLSEAD